MADLWLELQKILWPLGFALLFNLVMTPLIIRFAHFQEWYDRQETRKIHQGPVPRLGGIGIFLASLGVLFGAFGFFAVPFNHVLTAKLAAVLAGLVVFHIIGLVDDFRNIPARRKFSLQLAGALIIGVGTARAAQVFWPVLTSNNALLVAVIVAATIWTVSVVNAVNLIDGMDGLAGGVAAIAAMAVTVLGYATESTSMMLFAASLTGAVLAFLVFNKPRASIFMGDSGSLFLGGSLAAMPIMAGDLRSAGLAYLVLFAVMAVPGTDTAFSILRRLRSGVAIHAPDRGHVHHKLLDMGWTTRRILLSIYALSAFTAVATLILGLRSLGAGLAFVAVAWFIVSLFFIFVGARYRRARGPAARRAVEGVRAHVSGSQVGEHAK